MKNIVLNIPHSSINGLFDKELGGWPQNPYFLNNHVQKWTDWYTDMLFSLEKDYITKVVFPYSRFVCDLEQLENDEKEKEGQGIVYTRFGGFERKVTDEMKAKLMAIWKAGQEELLKHIDQYTILVDCHSFPRELDSCDICIGYNNDWSYDADVVDIIASEFKKSGYSVSFNSPYSNSLTPLAEGQDGFYKSVMIEVNKKVYLDERIMLLNPNSRQWMRWFGCLERIYDKLHNLD